MPCISINAARPWSKAWLLQMCIRDRVQITPDGLVICGSPTLSGGKICGYNDHRIVMSFAIAALRTCQSITVSDAESVRKSYPNFWEDYRKLGGNANVLNLG